jgi:hypothetical protein
LVSCVGEPLKRSVRRQFVTFPLVITIANTRRTDYE